MIISEQMKKLTATLRGIQSLTSEERKTASRLSQLMAEDDRGKSYLSGKKVCSHCINYKAKTRVNIPWVKRDCLWGRRQLPNVLLRFHAINSTKMQSLIKYLFGDN